MTPVLQILATTALISFTAAAIAALLITRMVGTHDCTHPDAVAEDWEQHVEQALDLANEAQWGASDDTAAYDAWLDARL